MGMLLVSSKKKRTPLKQNFFGFKLYLYIMNDKPKVTVYPEDSLESKMFWAAYDNSTPDISWDVKTGEATYFKKPENKKTSDCLTAADRERHQQYFSAMKYYKELQKSQG